MQCVYDNPQTCCREVWRDGKLVQWITASLIYCDGSPFSGPPWVDGMIWDGSPLALIEADSASAATGEYNDG